jgi:capsular polysaccharide transport system ATP-binding protein
MITLTNLTKSYRIKGQHKPIVAGLNFTFPRGRNLAIMGPNGAGKSTLMRLIAGAETPDRGQVIRHGKVSWPLGFAGGFNGSMTGLENLRFVARIYGQDSAAIIAAAEDFAALGPSLRLPIRSYSSGMKARLAFGLSMAIDFDVYLIDEITAVGDETFRRKSQAAFGAKLARSQIIMISHSETAIRAYCDGGLLMTPQGVAYHDRIDDLIAAYQALV